MYTDIPDEDTHAFKYAGNDVPAMARPSDSLRSRGPSFPLIPSGPGNGVQSRLCCPIAPRAESLQVMHTPRQPASSKKEGLASRLPSSGLGEQETGLGPANS